MNFMYRTRIRLYTFYHFASLLPQCIVCIEMQPMLSCWHCYMLASQHAGAFISGIASLGLAAWVLTYALCCIRLEEVGQVRPHGPVPDRGDGRAHHCWCWRVASGDLLEGPAGEPCVTFSQQTITLIPLPILQRCTENDHRECAEYLAMPLRRMTSWAAPRSASPTRSCPSARPCQPCLTTSACPSPPTSTTGSTCRCTCFPFSSWLFSSAAL